jgi:uncharacterized membrane protein YphA (DoxX/SURF4 family)
MLSIFSSRDARYAAIAIVVLCALGVFALHTPADVFDVADAESPFVMSGGLVPDSVASTAASDVYARANTATLANKSGHD